jgi:hypothetical protein
MSQQYAIPPGDVEYRTTLRDARGADALRLGYREVVTIDADGQAKVFKDSEYVALGDGRLFTAAMLATGKVELAICDLCRYPPRPSWWRRWWSRPEPPALGVMVRESGAFCAGCSQFVCRRHGRIETDGAVRCTGCAWSYTWRGFWRELFCERVDEDS